MDKHERLINALRKLRIEIAVKLEAVSNDNACKVIRLIFELAGLDEPTADEYDLLTDDYSSRIRDRY